MEMAKSVMRVLQGIAGCGPRPRSADGYAERCTFDLIILIINAIWRATKPEQFSESVSFLAANALCLLGFT